MHGIKSKQRVAEHGEVFTSEPMVAAMLDLVEGETDRIDSRFLEPACGSGNFLVQILQRKLVAVERQYGRSVFEKQHFSLLAVMCIYGVELLEDNLQECRANLLELLADYLSLSATDDLYRAATYVLRLNLVHGDALAMRTNADQAIVFSEWGYLGKGRYQRRDFSLHSLSQSAAFSEADSLFASVRKNEVFTPIKTYPPMTIGQLSELDDSQQEIGTG